MIRTGRRPAPTVLGAVLGVALTLSGCAALMPVDPVPVPPVRPAGLPDTQPPPPSENSLALARYYQRVENDLVTRGLLRTDGGGPDTPYDADDLARNFETIAFFDEYARGGGLRERGGEQGRLRRWGGPVRVAVAFGPSVDAETQSEDISVVSAYVERLARVTGHPVSMSARNPNFHVMFMGYDDSDTLLALLPEIVPNISPRTVDIFRDLPRSIHCLVVAFSGGANPQNYTKAVALIRAEHPDLIRLSCIHEEISQGLGLANDSPEARPSIFNDDDEFALLTSHDEQLLRMLYDPRLRRGMTADEARPVTRIIAREYLGQDL